MFDSAAQTSHRIIVLGSDEQFPPEQAVWGTGGWQSPEQREPVDWLVLARMLGWRAIAADLSEAARIFRSLRRSDTVIVGLDPATVSQSIADCLADAVQRIGVTLIVRTCSPERGRLASLLSSTPLTPFQARRLVWLGEKPPSQWRCRRPVEATALGTDPASRPLATLDQQVIVTERDVGNGRLVQLGFHPSRAADQSGHVTAMLRNLLTSDPRQCAAWFDWSGTMVLRMDDPGGSQNIYNQRWCYPKLDQTRWLAIGRELASHRARLSVGYVPGWVDDGDGERGTLWLNGNRIARRSGAIYPSPHVRYLDCGGHLPGTQSDCHSEYLGIRELAASGLVGIELHGFTHLHPDLQSWRQARDRYRNQDWFRDFDPTAHAFLDQMPAEKHPLNRGIRWLEQQFGCRPACLICPGDEWSQSVLEFALETPIQLISSYYLAIRQGRRWVWSNQICAPYLDQAEASWFDSGLPVVGYFHDYEPATEGVDWFAAQLDRWCIAGANRFIDFRETAAMLTTELALQSDGGSLSLHVRQPGLPIRRPRPVPVRLRASGSPLPESVTCYFGSGKLEVPVARETNGEGLIWLPVGCE